MNRMATLPAGAPTPEAAERSAAGRPRDPQALTFGRVTVRRMPGITDGGYTLDGLAAGVNIVHGPNASGKSTTARALESLLWPRAAAHRNASLEARFHLAGREWGVEVEGESASYQCDGRDADPPVLPPAEARDRYHLSLHELLRSDNSSFAAEIMRESAGGYDIGRAAESLHIRTTSPRRGKEAEALDEARTRLREAYAAEEALQQDERRLGALAARLEAAEAAALRVGLLERAVEYADAVAAEAAAVAAVAAFPPELASLRGDEADRLDGIRDRLVEVQRLLETAEAERRKAEAELQAAGVLGAAGADGAGSVVQDDVVLDTLRARLDSLRALEQAITAKETELAGARRQAAEELARIGEVVDEATLRGLDVVTLDTLAGFAEEAGRVRAALQAAQARLELLTGDAAREGDAAQVGKGIVLLQQWLRTGDGADPATAVRERRLRGLGAAAAGVLAAAGLVLLMAGLLPTAVAALLLLAGGVLLFLILRAAPAAADPREAHRREYERLGLERPRAWTAEGVAEVLDRLEARRAEARLAEERAAERERVARELEGVQRAWTELDARRAELAASFGVAPALEPAALYALANRISRWQDAAGRVAEREAELEYLRRQHADTLADAAARLAPFGYADLHDLPALAGAVEGVARRFEQHRRAATVLRHAEERIAGARSELEKLVAERRSIYERVGLQGDGDFAAAGGWGGKPDVAGIGARVTDTHGVVHATTRDPEVLVRHWCTLLPAYRTAVERRQGAEAVRRGAWERLTAAAGYGPGLEDRSADELRAELEEARRVAAAAGELRDEIAGIRTRLDLARRGHAVEAALAEVERCEAALREARDRDILGVVGNTLVAYLQRATRDEQRPAVFHRARELLALITRGRYRLDFEDGANPSFRAVDETTGRGHSLDELSSATRVQLLLAVRLAFVESQESGVRLPLIFDETLGNSDEVRAAAIMDATIALAAEGRQVFYFTAQPDEVAKWRAALERAGAVDWAVFDLADARRLARYEVAPLPATAPAARPELPAPGELSHDEYGRILLVPGLDLFVELGSVHLWYLVDDTALLYRLLTRRIETWGQLRSLVEHGGEALLGEDVRVYPRIRAAARTLETALELARIGRGRPVDREAIEASGAVSKTFMDRVVQLLTELHGDAARLVAAIEGGMLPRFPSNRRELLREFLEEQGYLDPREPLAPEVLRARVFAEVKEEVASGVLDAGLVDRIIGRVVAS